MEQLLDPWYAALVVTLLTIAGVGGYVILDRFVKWLQS